jgi:Domain of unknown function (DUF4105)
LANIIAWMKKRPFASAGLAVLGIVLIFTISVMTRTPQLERKWNEHLAVMPKVDLRHDSFALDPVMDWAYNANGPKAKGSTTFTAPYSDLKHVWFMVEPQPGGDYAAHTLVLFEFAGDRIVGLTVEARLEEGETYDAIAGLFNNFELAFIWSSSKELLTRRAVFLKKEIYVYPLALTADQEQGFLKSVLASTVDVESHARFYNTFTSNCTNELAKAAGLGWHYSWVLTGYSPQRLYDMKLIPGASFADAKANAKIDDEIRSWNDLSSPDFDRSLLAELRQRNGE